MLGDLNLDGKLDISDLGIMAAYIVGKADFDESMYSKCAELGIGLYFLTAGGKLRYRIAGRTKGNVLVRKRQYILSEHNEGVIIVSAMIFKPELLWKIEHFFSVKGGEPTDLYLGLMRVAGVFFFIAWLVA